jgi:transcriptional regulator with XRE-family HTH domain
MLWDDTLESRTKVIAQTAVQLGVSRLTLKAWLRGVAPPQRCLLARLAGFLRRLG